MAGWSVESGEGALRTMPTANNSRGAWENVCMRSLDLIGIW